MADIKQIAKVILLLAAQWACILVFPALSNAATSPWAEDQYSKARLVIGGQENNQYYAGVEIVAQPGWKMYWRTPGDAGFPPMLDWSESQNIQKFDIKWPVPARDVERFDGGELESYVYKETLFLPILAFIEDTGKPQTIKLRLDYGVCKEICIPAMAEFTLDIPANYSNPEQIERIKHALAKTPQPNGSNASLKINHLDWVKRDSKQYIAVQAESKQPFEHPDIFIETKAMFKFSAPEVVYADTTHATLYAEVIPTINKTISLQGNKLQVTLVNGDDAVEDSFVANALVNETTSAPLVSWVGILWLAFLGGLILNVMPCVLPVLSIKVLTLLQQGGAEMHEVRRGFIASALGIVASFLLLASITIGLKASGQAVGWGFHFQNPSFLIVLVIMLVLFASNLIGRFEINLPGGITDFLVHKTPMKHKSMVGDFMAGVFATILATPCTAPFLGTAISFALSRGAVDIMLIFSFMGLGLAFPYILFSIFPRWVTKLPKPGKWMVKVKYFLAVLLALTAIWLLWILSHNLGMKAAIVVFMAVLLIKFFVELKANGFIRIAGVVAVLVVIFTVPFVVTRQDAAKHALAEHVWTVFDEEAIPALVKEGKVVFVDVTADWCLTCKFNKMMVLNRMDVMKHFEELGVVAMRADITQPNPQILAYLKKYNRYGIPFNIVYGPAAPEGIPLNELLSIGEVKLALRQASKQKLPEKE